MREVLRRWPIQDAMRQTALALAQADVWLALAEVAGAQLCAS